ncbi:MAG TPA: glycosyltransferase family 39 protein [Blastocatellia bacterium]|nr:glycosyltransferase family 39 protein [Blastocatellia bacterium]
MRAEAPSLPATPTRHETGSQGHFDRRTVFTVFAAIVAVTFLLRIFYAGYLYQDDGLWFAAAEELLRGKALYRDIYFDKPPGIVLLYAALFKLFGAHILTIRLFTIVYSIAVSAMLYVFGRRFYSERIGLTAAALFAVVSTIFTTGHVQGLNTDFLMTLPYVAGAYWLLRSRDDVFGRNVTRRQSAVFAVAGGAAVAVATQTNPKGAFGLAFFALFLLLAHYWQRRVAASRRPRVWLFSLVGFAIGTLMFVIYLASNHALSDYWQDVWVWGARYARYYPMSQVIATALAQTGYYFLINNTLLAALLFVAVTTYKRLRSAVQSDAETATGASFVADAAVRADAALLLWFAVSFAGMSVGGRFFGHYFLQVLPALCLIGGRGLTGIFAALADQGGPSPESQADALRRARRRRWRLACLALLGLGFAVTFVRFHTRTAVFAVGWLRGAPGAEAHDWFHGRLKDEERRVAAAVKGLQPEAADALGLEALRRGGPRERPPAGPSDYLFVWGYRPEIYFWSGLLPASKYLSTQPLTGVPADIHYFSHDYRKVLGERDTAAARRELAEELAAVYPEYIIDELGFFNDDLAMARYAELADVLSLYKNVGAVERFIIYRRRDLIRATKQEKRESGAGVAEPR